MSLSFPTKAAGVGALAGLALSGFLYASLAPGIQPAAATTPVKTVATAEPVVLLRDCTPPAVLEGEVCVTHVTETVAVAAAPVAPAPAAPPPAAAPVRTVSSTSGTAATTGTAAKTTAAQVDHESEHESEHGDEHESEHESEHGDEHGDD